MIYVITNEKEKFAHIKATDIKLGDVDDVLYYFEGKDEVEFDTETSGLDAHINDVISAQFGDKKNQFVIDCATVDLREFKDLLEEKLILMQNAKFDLKFLYKHGIMPTTVYDTFLAEAVISMGIKTVRKSLDALVRRYCGETMDKEIRLIIHKEGLSERVIRYAANDVRYLGEIKAKQEIILKEKSLVKALSLDNKFVRVLAYVEYCGFYLDGVKWKNKMENDLTRLELAKERLNNYIFDNKLNKYISSQLDLFSDDRVCTINWSSSKQVISLFKDLGIDTKTKDKTTGKIKDSVDAKVLAPQSKKFSIIPLYTDYQQANKLTSTYGENVHRQIHPVTGRLHTSYRQLMDTGRMSCGGTDRARGIEMLNLQNVPADNAHRSCFVAEEGNTLVVADYTGQESVVFANFSRDPEIIDFYKKGMGDMHSFIASKIYPDLEGLTLNEIKSKHKDKRQNAKAAGFAIQYGGVGATIAGNLNLTIEEGEKIYKGYFEAFSGVKKYFAICKASALARGYVQLNNVSGRKSFIDFYDEYKRIEAITKENGFWEDYRTHKFENSSEYINHYKPVVRDLFKWKGMIERKSLNFPIQGTSAEITKFAGVLFFEHLLKHDLLNTVKICNIVHDEIVVECPKNISDEIANKLQECMEEAGKPFCKVIPLKAEPCVTSFWSH
jgi:DNA polymerase-1